MQKYPGIDLHDIWSNFSHEFSKWFQDFVSFYNQVSIYHSLNMTKVIYFIN